MSAKGQNDDFANAVGVDVGAFLETCLETFQKKQKRNTASHKNEHNSALMYFGIVFDVAKFENIFFDNARYAFYTVNNRSNSTFALLPKKNLNGFLRTYASEQHDKQVKTRLIRVKTQESIHKNNIFIGKIYT